MIPRRCDSQDFGRLGARTRGNVLNQPSRRRLRLVLDAEAFNALAGPSSSRRTTVRLAISAVERVGGELVVPAVVLAELYRPGRLAMVDACLARLAAVPRCRDTDRALARLVGGVLAAPGAGSGHLADAHVVDLP